MKIALLQSGGVSRDPVQNVCKIAQMAHDAVQQGARLLICPELFLSGYNIGDDMFALAEPQGGDHMLQVGQIAADNGIAILYGYPERVDSKLYNSACLLERDGRLIANYRKAHLYGDEENRLFAAGEDKQIIVELDGYRLGTMICYDVEFPEFVRSYALANVDIVAVPTALMQPQDFIAEIMVPTRAIENQIFVAYVNRCGQEGDLIYCGKSCLVGPDGQALVRAGINEELLMAEIDREQYLKWNEWLPYLKDRRPELY